jgi:hypothetical protein
MRGSPVRPGGPLTSKPTWWNTFGFSATSFFFALTVPGTIATTVPNPAEQEDRDVENVIARELEGGTDGERIISLVAALLRRHH